MHAYLCHVITWVKDNYLHGWSGGLMRTLVRDEWLFGERQHWFSTWLWELDSSYTFQLWACWERPELSGALMEKWVHIQTGQCGNVALCRHSIDWNWWGKKVDCLIALEEKVEMRNEFYLCCQEFFNMEVIFNVDWRMLVGGSSLNCTFTDDTGGSNC